MRFNKLVPLIMILAFASSATANDLLLLRPPKKEAANATQPLTVDNATELQTGNVMKLQTDNATAEADNATSPLREAWPLKVKTHSVTETQNATVQPSAQLIPLQPDVLQRLSERRAFLALLDVEAQIAQVQKKIRDASTFPVGTFDRQNTQKTPSKKQVKREAPRPKVVAVQGVNGKLAAILTANGGYLTVHEGDKVGSGTVTSISLDQVRVKYGRKETSLSFKE